MDKLYSSTKFSSVVDKKAAVVFKDFECAFQGKQTKKEESYQKLSRPSPSRLKLIILVTQRNSHGTSTNGLPSS